MKRRHNFEADLLLFLLVDLSSTRRDWNAQHQSYAGPSDTDPGGDIEVSCLLIECDE